MDVKTFLANLLSSLASIDFIKYLDLKTEGHTLSGRIFLKDKMFLEVYYNELTETIAFALIKEEKRIWGIDKDKIRDWHIHPFDAPQSHELIQPLSILEVVLKLKEVWENIKS